MKINKEERKRLYLDGLSDKEIAKRLNCAEITIKFWRQRNKLKSSFTITRNLTHDKLIKLWENGLTDKEIAKELKYTKATIWKFRKKNGMGSNVGIFDWREERANGKAKRV